MSYVLRLMSKWAPRGEEIVTEHDGRFLKSFDPFETVAESAEAKPFPTIDEATAAWRQNAPLSGYTCEVRES